MKVRKPFPTPIQNIALDLVFEVMGEERVNRTSQEYRAIAARLPALKRLEFLINTRLRQLHKSDRDRLYEICRFGAGHKRYAYEPFPKKISYETLRAALTIAGMRPPRKARRKAW
jgi:hypothetical protein